MRLSYSIPLSVLLVAISHLSSTYAQFVRPPTDLITKAGAAGVNVRYKEVPTGICETRPNVTHLSGYVDVASESHLHFQFFETRRGDPRKAPLTIWLGGGPGSSSLGGLFAENGPCSIDANITVVDNPYSWNEVSNLIYVDQPLTTGASYTTPSPGYINRTTLSIVSLPSEECPEYAAKSRCGTYSSFSANNSIPKTTAEAAPEFYLALQGFIGAFPEYASSVNIATESYGGHYVEFGRYIIEQNKLALPGHVHVDLHSFAIGNGWFKPTPFYKSYISFMKKNPYGIQYSNDTVYEMLERALPSCLDQLEHCYKTDDLVSCKEASAYCEDHLGGSVLGKLTGRSTLDIRQMSPSRFPPTFHRAYLNQAHIQAALGLYVNFTSASTYVTRAFRAAADSPREGRTSIEKLRFLLDEGVNVALYVGDADYICNVDAQTETVEMLALQGMSEAGWTDLKTSDGKLHGQTKQSGSFSFTQFFLAGHEVPFFKPLASLEFIERVINRKDIATGTQDVQPGSNYKTTGPSVNFIFHGNATVEYKVLPINSTYDTSTGKATPPPDKTVKPTLQRRVERQLQRLFAFTG